MTPCLSKLVEVAGLPLVPSLDTARASRYLECWGRHGKELVELLGARNGFMAFESCLLVRPFAESPMGLSSWNSPVLWKQDYCDSRLDEAICFAENVFGMQYALTADGVAEFDPETGSFEVMGCTLELWAEQLLGDRDYRTGWPLGHDWQTAHRALFLGERLVPAVPFVLGGAFAVQNLRAMRDVDAMKARAAVAVQIRDIPDGGKVVLRPRRATDGE